MIGEIAMSLASGLLESNGSFKINNIAYYFKVWFSVINLIWAILQGYHYVQIIILNAYVFFKCIKLTKNIL